MENTCITCDSQDEIIKQLQSSLDYGGVLYYRWNTERRDEVIRRTCYGVGWFYNGDKMTGAPTLANLVERKEINLNAWDLIIKPRDLKVSLYTQLELPEIEEK